jgi:hypothetical protein
VLPLCSRHTALPDICHAAGATERAPLFRMHRLLFTYPDMPAGLSFLPQ